MLGVKHSMIPSSLGNKAVGKNFLGNKQYPHAVTSVVRTNADTPIGENDYTKDTQYLPTGISTRRTKGIHHSLEKK